jgi:hypothetical protein
MMHGAEGNGPRPLDSRGIVYWLRPWVTVEGTRDPARDHPPTYTNALSEEKCATSGKNSMFETWHDEREDIHSAGASLVHPYG